MIPSATALPLFTLLTLTLGIPLDIKITEGDIQHDATKDTLRLVTVVIRHGDRAPVDTYPNDPHINDSMEPYGWGQLTNEGRINQYNQGSFLRKRYDSFLGSKYHPDIFYLQTTHVDRTKMSGQLEAAALWKPSKEQTFEPDLPWQPITLFYQESQSDTFMLVWDTCPRYAQLRSSADDLPEARRMNEDNKQLFAELSNITGMPIKTVDDVSSLYSTLTAEEYMNLDLPEWTKDYYPDKLVPSTLFELQLNTHNDEFRRLKGGPMLKKFTDDMLAKREGTLKPEKRKMYMYIGHDSTIVTLLDTMHIWCNQMPYFNIMTMIELHEDEGEWNVQVFLRNTTDHEPYPMTIPGCTVVCPLDKFVEILKPMTPDNWKEECKVIRHGNRASVDTYPNDPYINNTMEPYGWGQLTNKGRANQYASLLDTMHIWHNQMPYYNITVMIELHEVKGEWNVQIFLRNTTDHEPYPMTIPGCTVGCPLDKFVEILKPMTPDNWEEECKVDNYTTPTPSPP